MTRGDPATEPPGGQARRAVAAILPADRRCGDQSIFLSLESLGSDWPVGWRIGHNYSPFVTNRDCGLPHPAINPHGDILRFRCNPFRPPVKFVASLSLPKCRNQGMGGSIVNRQETNMAKISISLLSVQKPTSNASPVFQRSNRFSSGIKQQSLRFTLLGGRVSREKFWIDGGSMFFALMYGKQALKLEKGMSTSKGSDLG